MPMKIRDKNPLVKEAIANMGQSKVPLWKAAAKALNRPQRIGFAVNLFSLEKNAHPQEQVLVPGKVLGSGEIQKSLTVAALMFSGEARKKIEKAGGVALSIPQLMEKNPEGKGVRIMG